MESRKLHRQTCSSLCLTSNTLYQNIVSQLYKSPDCMERGARNKQHLIRTLCCRPDLARLIQSHKIDHPTICRRLAPYSTETTLFKVAIGDLIALDFYANMYNSLIQGCHKAELVMIMMLARNVRDITLIIDCQQSAFRDCPCPDMQEAIRTIFNPARLATHTPEAFGNLRSVTLTGLASSIGWAYQTINNLLQLKSIKQWVCEDMQAMDSTLRWDCPSKASNITDLQLVRCQLDTAAFAQIVRSCKALKRLHIGATLCPRRSSFFDPDGKNVVDSLPELAVNVDELQDALNCHSEFLTDLSLVNGLYGGTYRQDWKFHRELSTLNLNKFSALRTLSIDQDLLVGKKPWAETRLDGILPSSLSRLTVHTQLDVNKLPELLKIFQKYSNTHLQWLRIDFATARAANRREERCKEVPWRTPTGEKAWELREKGGRKASFVFSVDAERIRLKMSTDTVRDQVQHAIDSWPTSGGFRNFGGSYGWGAVLES